MVIWIHGMDQSGVRFPPGPPRTTHFVRVDGAAMNTGEVSGECPVPEGR